MRYVKGTYEYGLGNKSLKRRGKYSLLHKRAKWLNSNLPLSEKWFRSLFNKESFFKECFFNVPMSFYIPDCVNFNKKYIIEIDGSIHKEEDQQKHDERRDAYFIGRGFKIFRVKAFDHDSYNQVIAQIREIHNPPCVCKDCIKHV